MLFRDKTSGVLQIQYADQDFPLSYREISTANLSDNGGLTLWCEDVTLLQALTDELAVRVHDSDMTLKAGDLLYVNTLQLHSLRPQEGAKRLRVLRFHPRLLGDAVAQDALPCRVLQDESLRCLRFEAESTAGRCLGALMERFAQDGDPASCCYRLECLSLAAQVMLTVCVAYREGREPLSNQERKDSAAMRTMLALVALEYPQKLSLERLAQAGGVSRSKCCKLFARYVGRSPMDYLCCHRLQTAAELLLTTELPIQSIANRCGFPEQSYFTRLFKARFGLTPGQCRRRGDGA